MSLIDFAKIAGEAYTTAVEKGWYKLDEAEKPIPRDPEESIALIHSEVSEAVEELRRSDIDGSRIWYGDLDGGFVTYDLPSHKLEPAPRTMKPEGVPVELADVVIRIGNMCGSFGSIEGVTRDLDYVSRSRNYLPKLKPLPAMAQIHKRISHLHGEFELRIINGTVMFDSTSILTTAHLLSYIVTCESFQWDLQRGIDLKLIYNKTRSARHGNKKA